MTVLPDAGYISSNDRTEGEHKQWLEDVRSVVASLPGGSAVSAVTIASGVILPTQAVHTVDTEAAAAADDLRQLSPSSLDFGRQVTLRPANLSRVVTIKHWPGPTAGIILAGGADFILDHEDKSITLEYRSDERWHEIRRQWGEGIGPSLVHWGGTSAGSGGQMFVTLDPPPASYYPGLTVAWLPSFTNAGILHLQVGNLGLQPLLYRGTALLGGEVVAGQVAVAVHDGTRFNLLRRVNGDIVQAVQGTTTVETTSTTAAWTDTGLEVTITPRLSTRMEVMATTSGQVSRPGGTFAAGAWRLLNATSVTQLSVTDLSVSAGGATALNAAGAIALHAHDVSPTIGITQTYKVQQFRVAGNSVTSQYFTRIANISVKEIM